MNCFLLLRRPIRSLTFQTNKLGFFRTCLRRCQTKLDAPSGNAWDFGRTPIVEAAYKPQKSFIYRPTVQHLLRNMIVGGLMGALLFFAHMNDVYYEMPLTYLKKTKKKPGDVSLRLLTFWKNHYQSQPFHFRRYFSTFVQLLDDSYPVETRILALEFVKTMIVFNDEKESSPVFFDKCFFKKTMLATELGGLFCRNLFSCCVEEANPKLQNIALEIYTTLSDIPNYPPGQVVEELRTELKVPANIVIAALLRHGVDVEGAKKKYSIFEKFK